jgi:hypothetical protein
MQAARLNVARVGEEAWNRLEPQAGQHALAWLGRAIRQAARHPIAIIIQVPAGAAPQWRLQAHPSAAGGVCVLAGRRDRALALLERLAQALGHEGNVHGWELGRRTCLRSLIQA